MKILIVGASGRVGTKLATVLTNQGHTVFGTYSHHQPAMANTVKLDLHSSVSEIQQVVQFMDAVYFVAGSRGRDLLQTDLFGAVKVMQAAQLSGVHRFIQLSSAYDLQPARWSEGYLRDLTDYNIAKGFADDWLIHRSHLDYTILQPGVLTETPATGQVSFDEQTLGNNSIDDVVTVLTELLDNNKASHRVIMMKVGDLPISQALQQL